MCNFAIQMEQNVIITDDLRRELPEQIVRQPHDRLFVLTDTQTLRLCWPLVEGLPCFSSARMITIGDTDEHKNLESLTSVWRALQQGDATRHSLLVNLGGGMVTDLGGFAASTFKRGIAFINVPTTLLSQVDASVGGKTGINFGGLKNEIGVFRQAESVVISTDFLPSLDHQNLLSGYAEMLKHGLIASEEDWKQLLGFELEAVRHSSLTTLHSPQDTVQAATHPLMSSSADNSQRPKANGLWQQLGQLIAKSVAIKERIVLADPTEKGLRKALNLGHTLGHALESLALETHRPVLHGYAVAWGLVGELYLSTVLLGFPKQQLQQTVQFIRHNYGTPLLDCKHYDRLLELMKHDKKNVGDSINFTLLGGIGDIRINQQATRDDILEALDFIREG